MGPQAGPFVGTIVELPESVNRNERKGTIKREGDGQRFQFRVRALDPNLSASDFGSYLEKRYNFCLSPDPNSLAWNLNPCAEPSKAAAEKAKPKGSAQAAPKAQPKKQSPPAPKAAVTQQKALAPSNTSPTQASNTQRKSGNSGEGISVAPCGLNTMKGAAKTSHDQVDPQPAPPAPPVPAAAAVVERAPAPSTQEAAAPQQPAAPQEPTPAPKAPVKKEKGVLDDKTSFPPLGGATKPQQTTRKNQHGGRDPPKEKQPNSKTAAKQAAEQPQSKQPEPPAPQQKAKAAAPQEAKKAHQQPAQPQPQPQAQAAPPPQQGQPPPAPAAQQPPPTQAPPPPQPMGHQQPPPPQMQHQMPPQQVCYPQVNGVGPVHRQSVVRFSDPMALQYIPGQSCYIEMRDDDNKGFQLCTATITDPAYSFLDLLAEAHSVSADMLDDQRWEFREESGRCFVTHAAILAQAEGGVCVRVRKLGPHLQLQ